MAHIYQSVPTSDKGIYHSTSIQVSDEEMSTTNNYFPRCCPVHFGIWKICFIFKPCVWCICEITGICRVAFDWIFSCSSQQKRIKRLEEENNELYERIEEQENNIEKLKMQINELRYQVRSLEERNTTLTKAYETEKEEKEKALTRLSSVAGDRLRLNNPAIADLSDENRPNKLAEKFSELYDNEWTEFYEYLEKKSNGSTEEESIGQIIQLLQETYTTSNNFAVNQRKVLMKAITYPPFLESEKVSYQTANVEEGVLPKIIELQKRTASIGFEVVQKTILGKFTHLENSDAKNNFIERCSQLCWMMAIQDPPMQLDFGPPKGSLVDKNVFRLYTKSGQTVDFVVWPAVFLHQEGPLVQKGVLQPLAL